MPAWLNSFTLEFPDPALFANEEGLIAVGGDLSPERLLEAYRVGIFPWFSHGGEPYWFCPDPRCVVIPKELKVAKSMRPIFNQNRFSYSLDTQFRLVMQNCRDIWRPADLNENSWITDDFMAGYGELHDLGLAHSVEVWEGQELVGGLYGVSLGRCFYGESMFSLVPNASKAGFIRLVEELERRGFWLIDCQVRTEHLMSLGAREIHRSAFLEIMKKNGFEASQIGRWTEWWAA